MPNTALPSSNGRAEPQVPSLLSVFQYAVHRSTATSEPALQVWDAVPASHPQLLHAHNKLPGYTGVPPKTLTLNKHNSHPNAAHPLPPRLNCSSKNAKNFPRHSGLYSYPSWLPAALQAGKNITEETTYGVTNKTCQVKIRATLYYRSKKAQELRFWHLAFGPILKSYSQTLRPSSDWWVHCEVQRSAPTENKYFKKSLVQCQRFTTSHVPQGSLGEAKPLLHTSETQRWTHTVTSSPKKAHRDLSEKAKLLWREELFRQNSLIAFLYPRYWLQNASGFLRHTLCCIPATSWMPGTPSSRDLHTPRVLLLHQPALLITCEHTAELRALPSASLQSQKPFLLQKSTTNHRIQNKIPTHLQNQKAQAWNIRFCWCSKPSLKGE